MTEQFNVEKFRQQMRGQAPVAPQAVPAQMQGGPAVMHQAVPHPIPAPHLIPAPQMQRQMAAQPVPQPMAPPMPQNPGFQTQPPNQAYNPPAGGQPQAWAPQGQAMQAQAMQVPQMMQPQAGAIQMPQAPVFAPPPATVAAPQLDEAAPKKSRFSLKRSIKEKTPKIEKAAKDKTAEVHTTKGHSPKTSPAMIFMFGMATGIVCFLVGNMIMSNVFASKSANNIGSMAKSKASIQQPVLPTSDSTVK